MVLFLFILGNEIEDEGTKEIAKPLKIKKNLTPFVLRSTYCDVALEVAKSLKINKTLTSLDIRLTFCDMAKEISKSLEINKTLTTLNLCCTFFIHFSQ